EIICAANVQHNCSKAKCSGLNHRSLRQERERTHKTVTVAKHNNEPYYLFNTRSIHNYSHIRNAVPSSL
ncbi:hypothetical protein BDW22DRAFT_1303591, partial [Trametopsis cervina]